MDFRVLGPVQVLAGSGPVELAAGRQVALLAYLLIARDEVVSRDRLIDALWGEAPPPTATNALQVQVHALRKRLGAERIAREGVGYRLCLESGELDLERFEQLTTRGRAELADGRPVEAAATLKEALALWRGQAYEDVRYEVFAQAEVARLDELRLAAIEDRIQADLALGRHRELVSELEALVAEHHGRERLCGQLMLALYRSGRQTAALDVFQQARQTMRDELGLEPGPELQELQQAVLRQDPALAVKPPELRARRRLPAPETPLVGRAAELAELTELLRGGTRLVTLTGAGGIGKTRLALQTGHELAKAFTDGVYFVDLSHLSDPGLVPDEIVGVLGLSTQRDEPPAAAVQAFLEPRRALLLLDNFEVVDAAAPLVSELLRAAPGLVVLVTSRAPLRLSGEHQYRVEPLPLDDAVRLFAARARAVAPSFRRPTEDAEDVAQLCLRLDCLPLAIELSAARTRDYAPDELLASVPGSLALAGEGARDLPSRQRTLRATIDWSHRLLAPEEQALFTRLAVFAGGFTAASAADVCGAIRESLAALVAASLVHERAAPDGGVRGFMLETVREYALERLEEAGESEALRRRHAEHYAAVAEAVEDEHPASRSGAAWQMLETEHDNFRAALDWSRDHGTVELQLRIVGALGYFWATTDHLREGRARIDEALEHAADAPGLLRANAFVGMSRIAQSLGDYERMRASAQGSLDLFRQLGDEARTALALNHLGIALSNLGDIDGGIVCHEENAAISRRLGDGMRLSSALNNLGYCRLRRGQYDAARPLFEEGLSVSREIGHGTAESVMLGNLGLGALLQHRAPDALAHFRDALRIDRDLGYTEGAIYGVVGIAAALAEAGDALEAATLLGVADTAARASAVELEPLELELHARVTAGLQDTLGRGFDDAYAAGQTLSLDDAVERALSAALKTGVSTP
ncbi:MAG TPA: BTAD domain-containing putative transcriptional regulator [Solirubrobacteraceae bacterium]|nr:BTAD domain-containing putative transcriptional regulator [Solirubrobacteraceae bacterium]